MAIKPPEDDEPDILDDVEAVSEHPILSAEDVAKARAKAKEKLQAERRAAAMRDVEAQETERLRREEGLTTGISSEDELVWLTIDLPDWSPSINVNGMPYWHGHPYRVPRHVQRTLLEQMQNAWRAHDQTEGKSTAQMFQSRRNSVINGRTGVIDNAPRRFDA